MKNLKRNDLNPVTTVYVAMLVCGLGIFALEPTWTGLGAVLLVTPGIAINLAFPARRKGVRA